MYALVNQPFDQYLIYSKQNQLSLDKLVDRASQSTKKNTSIDSKNI